MAAVAATLETDERAARAMAAVSLEAAQRIAEVTESIRALAVMSEEIARRLTTISAEAAQRMAEITAEAAENAARKPAGSVVSLLGLPAPFASWLAEFRPAGTIRLGAL